MSRNICRRIRKNCQRLDCAPTLPVRATICKAAPDLQCCLLDTQEPNPLSSRRVFLLELCIGMRWCESRHALWTRRTAAGCRKFQQQGYASVSDFTSSHGCVSRNKFRQVSPWTLFLRFPSITPSPAHSWQYASCLKQKSWHWVFRCCRSQYPEAGHLSEFQS